MVSFRFAPRWHDIASTWDDDGVLTRQWRTALELLEQRDQRLEAWLNRTDSLVICSSSTRPSSPVEGQAIYETDTNKLYVYDGAAWVPLAAISAWDTWTPVITQSVTITKTVNQASYEKRGRRVTGSVHLTTTANGTGANDLVVSYPASLTPVDTSFGVIGHGFINNTIGGTSKPIVVIMATASGFKFGIDGATLWNTEALVSGAIVGFRFDFEATT